MIIEVGNVLVSMDIFTEKFVCDISACQGRCCEEGDAGAPLTLDEVAEIEDELDSIWSQLSAGAQAVIDQQGVAYIDEQGDLVTSIVNKRDCAFRGPHGCLLKTRPISCHLYPIREKTFNNGIVGLNYHQWNICQAAKKKGAEEGTPVYVFLREPLIRRFGEDWYKELETVAEELKAQGII